MCPMLFVGIGVGSMQHVCKEEARIHRRALAIALWQHRDWQGTIPEQ